MRRAHARGGTLQLATCGLVVLAGVVVGTALAGNAPRSPLAFVLRPPDFPAKADPVDAGPMPVSFARKLRGIRAVGRGAQYFASIPFGPERSQTVYGLVVTTPSVAHARRVFAWQKRTEMKPGRGGAALGLSRFGDEQVALASREPDSGSLLVRQGTTVWRIEVAADGRLSLSPSRVRDELTKYAAKQRDRIG